MVIQGNPADGHVGNQIWYLNTKLFRDFWARHAIHFSFTFPSGSSLALMGNGLLAVGASGDGPGGVDAGSAFLFSIENNATLNHTASILSPGSVSESE